MRFIRAVVSLPDMIAIALVCITSAQSDIPTSLARHIRERIITVAIILSAVKIKKLSAVLAFVRVPLRSNKRIMSPKQCGARNDVPNLPHWVLYNRGRCDKINKKESGYGEKNCI